MDTETCRTMGRRYFEKILNGLDRSVGERILGPDVVFHGVTTIEGRAPFLGFVAMLHTAFPDLRFTVEDEIAETNRYVGRFTLTGAQSGPFLGHPPTGKTFTISGIDILRFDGDRIAEIWGIVDALSQLQQLGLFPSAAKS